MQKQRRRNWFLRSLLVGLAVLVVAVPVAQARVDGSSGWSGPRQEQGVSDLSSVIPGQAVRSQWLPIVQPSTTPQEVLRSSWLGIVQPKIVPEPSPAPTQVASRPDGFDWGDAGIGAGTVFAVLLLAAGGLLGSRRVRDQATA